MANPPTILFICEHGAAKSVVAATYLNHLVRERHLPFRAISRGTDPASEMTPNAVTGLLADGLTLDTPSPTRLTSADLTNAVRVIAFCDLPAEYGDQISVERWSDVPPVSEDYARARDAIVEKVSRLLDDLAKRI